MPTNRQAVIRQMVIDRCLSCGRGYTMRQLMKECNNELVYKGELPVSAMNTIRADVRSIDERHASARRSGHVNEEGYTIVEVEHKGRNKYYRYWREGFSIYKPELDSKEMAGLIQAVIYRQFYLTYPTLISEIGKFLMTYMQIGQSLTAQLQTFQPPFLHPSGSYSPMQGSSPTCLLRDHGNTWHMERS